MRIKRKLKKMATADHRRILDKNEDFYKNIMAEHYPNYRLEENKPKPRMRVWQTAALIATVFIIAVTATLLGLFLTNNNNAGDNFDDTKIYFEVDIHSKKSDLSDLDSGLHSVSLNTSGYQINVLESYYDSLSNDTLYYKLVGSDEDGMEDWKLMIEVNKYYKLPYSNERYVEARELNSYTVRYHSAIEEDDGIYIITVYAMIVFETEKIYIEYECLAFEEDSNMFFDWLEKVIIAK